METLLLLQSQFCCCLLLLWLPLLLLLLLLLLRKISPKLDCLHCPGMSKLFQLGLEIELNSF